MVGVVRRMNILKEVRIMNLRHGPGAAVLPRDVTRIHMDFALKLNGGHMGARKFWRENLPRLKYWNPAIPMIVNRGPNQEAAAKMTVYFRDTSIPVSTDVVDTPIYSATHGHNKAPAPKPWEKTVEIEMKDVHSDKILAEFLTKTGAVPVKPTPQEELDMQEIEARNQKSAQDKEIGRKRREAQLREEAMLAQARSEAAAVRNAD
ncbi:Mitochondrial ribosomal protein L51 / S25 / CI-B8 domain containing protein [Naviculisporaceae sp. PSN 640]